MIRHTWLFAALVRNAMPEPSSNFLFKNLAVLF